MLANICVTYHQAHLEHIKLLNVNKVNIISQMINNLTT